MTATALVPGLTQAREATLALVPEPTIPKEATLDAVLPSVHDAWMADADRLLGPVTDPNATFWDRWAAVRFVSDLFQERFELEQVLLNDLHPFLEPELNGRLWMQVDRLDRLYHDINQLARRRGTAREIAHMSRDFLEALRIWYADIEFAAGDIRQRDLSRKATQILAQLRGGWADWCCAH